MTHLLNFFICLSILGVHVVWSIVECDPQLVSRSGSAIVAIGLIIESWKVINTPRKDNMPMWGDQNGHSALRASIIIIVFGTLIQGYADLIFTKLVR